MIGIDVLNLNVVGHIIYRRPSNYSVHIVVTKPNVTGAWSPADRPAHQDDNRLDMDAASQEVPPSIRTDEPELMSHIRRR